MTYKKISSVFFSIILFTYCITIFGRMDVDDLDESIALGQQDLSYKTEIIIEIDTAGIVEHIALEQYIIGILPLCIPVEYEIETLKVQAILLRTQLLKEYQQMGTIQYDQTRGYLNVSKMKELWGDMFDENYEKLLTAVTQTKGIFITYENQIILPSYFKISNGYTRNANEILQNQAYPYLVSVACEEDFMAEDYFFTKEISLLEWTELFEIDGSTSLQIHMEYDSAFYCTVFTMQYELDEITYQIVLQGERARSILELPSSSFTIECGETSIQIQGKGVGHGVGLSQYGANALAIDGKNFMEIIAYYFNHVDFDKIE